MHRRLIGTTLAALSILALAIPSSGTPDPPWYFDFDFAALDVLAYWPLDGDAIDYGPQTHIGSWSGGSDVVGYFGLGRDFGPGDYFQVNGSAALSTFDRLTMSAWYLPTAMVNNEALVGAGDNTSGPFYGIWAIRLSESDGQPYHGGAVSSTHIGITCLFVPTQAAFTNTWFAPIEYSQWHHLACTYDPATGGKLYVDGVLAVADPFYAGTISVPLARPFFFNFHEWAGGGASSSRLSGVLDEVTIFNRALSATEVELLSVDDDGDGRAAFWTPPNAPPVADAQRTVASVECTGPSGTQITLDGTGSTDPDGDELTYAWSGPFGQAAGAEVDVVLPEGTHTITLTVMDEGLLMSSDSVEVTVQDTTAPDIDSATPSPDSLWPPNKKMVPVIVSVDVSDACSSASCQIVSVSSNEPINGNGSGNTAPDWEITSDLTVDLRAERLGKGGGRIYTITLDCTDDAGNVATTQVEVSVPHSNK